jgi:hypothetical protein
VTENNRLGSLEEIVRYIRANRGTYTDDAIRKRLVDAGNQEWAVKDAFRLADRADVEQQRDPRRWWLFVGYAIGLFVAAFALLVWGSDMVQQTYGIGAAVLFACMGIGLAVAIVLVRRNRSFALGLTNGVMTALLIPFVIVAVIAGLCVYTTSPNFFAAAPPANQLPGEATPEEQPEQTP